MWVFTYLPEHTTDMEVAGGVRVGRDVTGDLDGFTGLMYRDKTGEADLYAPNTMPPVLIKAHSALDKAVDLCYRPQAFTGETNRI